MSASIHNHAHLDDDEVLERFVVRQDEYQLLREHLVDADPPRHALVIAPRGMGKSLLARRLAVAAGRDEDLAAEWLAVVLPEELYTVTSIGEFWLAVLRGLAVVADSSLTAAHDALLREPDASRMASLAAGRVARWTEEHDRKVLVVVENLDMLFEEQLNADDGWALRKTLQNEKSLLLVGTAVASFAQIESHESALYDFFRVVRLEALTLDETRALWEETTGHDPGPVQALPIRVLTGGNPRMLTILGRFTGQPDLGGLLDDLERLVDEYTPYFKANIEHLPAVQRKVFVTLADLWSPSTAAEVAVAARMDTSKASALLGRMVRQGLVRVVEVDEGPRRYELVERLYQLFHLLRNVEQTGRVRALVDVIRHLYTPVDLHRQVMPELAERLGGSSTHVLVASGLERHLDAHGHEVFTTLHDFRERQRWLERLHAKQVATLGTDHQTTLASGAEIAYCVSQLGDHQEAHERYSRIASGQSRVLGADHPDTLTSCHMAAYCIGELGDHHTALELYEDVAERATQALGEDHRLTRSARGGAEVHRARLRGPARTPREMRDLIDADAAAPSEDG